MLSYIFNELVLLFLGFVTIEKSRIKPYIFAWFISLLFLGIWLKKGMPGFDTLFLFPFLPWGLMFSLGFESTNRFGVWFGHIIFLIHGFFFFATQQKFIAYVLYIILLSMLFLSVKGCHSVMITPMGGV